MKRFTSEMRVKCLLIIISVACFTASTSNLSGQALYGSIYGQVTDPSGAAIPNATITVTDVTKGTSVQATSSASGEYSVEHLIPDDYDVTATAQGFRVLGNKGLHVSADTSPKVDFKLEVGTTAETVNVIAAVPLLKTDRADVAKVFNEKTVSELPIAGRNFASLELLIPGAQVMAWSQNSAEDSQGSPTVQINGQHFSGVSYELDGAANQDPILGQIVINPPLDGVTEAKLATQNYDAEFGQAVAAVVTSQTKSGTNSFHGDAFDYRRSDAQQARNPFTQYAPDVVTGRLLPPAIYSQFGGSVGGPILKDKAFFFGDYQAVRQKLGASARETVPTDLMHNSCLSGNGCDLSEYLAARGAAPGQIYNPRIINPVTGPGPFANNLIPNQYLSTPALNLLKLIPLPNGSGITNNYAAGGVGVVNQNQFDVRVDTQLSERTHAFGRYSYFDNVISSGTIFGAAGGTGFSSPTNSFGGSASARDQGAVAGMDIAIRPDLLTDFRLGYLRYHVNTHKFDGTQDLATQVGIPGLNLGTAFTSGSPAFYINNASGTNGDGLSNFGSGLNVNACNCTLLETEDQYQAVNNWTKVVGTHSIKFGADLRYGRNLRVPSDSNRAGELSFSATDTENPTLVSSGGLGLATFLLGDATSISRYVSTSTNAKESQKRVFTYVEDSWRVTPNLTLNLGLRWEIYFPETVNGRGQGGFADLTTGNIRVAGVGPYNTAMNVKKVFDLLAPRIGFAYQLNPRTVIRSGYGRSFDIGVFGSIFGHVVTQSLPVLANQNLNSSGPNTAAFNLAVGPAPFVFPTIPANGAIPIPDGDNVNIRDDPNRFPTVDAWNLAIQRQLNSSISVTLAYVGNKGTHTFAGDNQTTNPNEAATCIPASESSTGQTLCWNPNPVGTGQTNNPILLQRYYKIYGWSQALTYYHDAFNTHYNALQVTVDKHFSQGLQFSANYAWQAAFNDGGDYQEIDRRVDYGRYDDLRNQQLTLFGNYELPFGRNRMFGSGVKSWVNYIIGGYQLSSNLNWASGLPFTPTYGECGTDIPAGPCMPNKTAARMPLSLSSFSAVAHSRTYFTPGPTFGTNGSASGVFIRPNINQFGTVGRNNYYGPSFFADDLSLLKNFPIHESIQGQFRVDAFNAFNHIAPGNPNGFCIDCAAAGSNGVVTSMGLGVLPRQLQFSITVSF
jgi:Carboxypeptidase regulatory-like domain/TonB dependent receptor